MSLIHRFNRYILIPVLTEWLCPPDFVELDTALCSRSDREYFFMIMDSYTNTFQKFVFSYKFWIPLSIGLFDWCDKRHFDMKTILKTKDLDITDYSLNRMKVIGKDNRGMLISQLSNVDTLNMDNCCCIRKYSEKLLMKVLHSCSHLQDVVFSEFKLSTLINKSIVAMAQNCPLMKTFYAQYCMNVDEDSLILLVRSCPLLERIWLFECNHMTTRLIKAVIVHSKNMNTLGIESCFVHALENAKCCFPLLALLGRQKLLLNLVRPSFTTTSLKAYTMYCGVTLQKLSLYDSPVTDDNLIVIGRYCTSLILISLAYCVNVSDFGILELCSARTALQIIDLDFMDNLSVSSVYAVTRNCSKLEEFSLSYNSQMRVSEHCVLPTTLEKLKLCRMPFINDWAVPVISRCGQLTDLTLSDNPMLTDLTVASLAPYLSRLVRLKFRDCPRLTDESLVALSRYCHHIDELFLKDCQQISDKGLIAILSSNLKITLLDVAGLFQLTQATLDALCEYSLGVEVLDISGAKDLTAPMLMHIVCKLKRLRHLYPPCHLSLGVVHKHNPKLQLKC